MKISMYATKEMVRNFALENGYAPNDGVMAQIYALYEVAKWKRAEIASHLDYAASTVSTKRSRMWEYVELAEMLFEEVSELGDIVETLDEMLVETKEVCKEEKRVLVRSFRDSRPDVMMEFMPECGDNLKNTNAVYFFKFYDTNSLLFNKIGTSTRDVIGRLRDEIGEYTKKFDIRRVEIHRICSCGDMPPEGAESMLRAKIMKEYPNTFRKNDRFFGVDVSAILFDEIIASYLSQFIQTALILGAVFCAFCELIFKRSPTIAGERYFCQEVTYTIFYSKFCALCTVINFPILLDKLNKICYNNYTIKKRKEEVNTMRVKCPNCNSSMMIVLTWEDRAVYSTIHTREYECKCGCAFEVNYIAEEPKILHKPIDK